jgi:hypothetical protein
MIMRVWLLCGLLAACSHQTASDPPPKQPAATPKPAPAPTSSTSSQPEHPMVAKLREFKDRACTCKDKPCVDAVQKDLIAWAYAQPPESGTKPSEADAKAADEINEQLEKCIVAAGGKL